MATSTAQSNANISGLISQGYTQEQIGKFDYGNKMNSGEVQRFLAQSGPSPLEIQKQTALTNLNNAANMTYQFDPNKYLPGIQQQADAIYAPQQAQLEAIRQLQSMSYDEQAVTTNKDFDKQLQTEIESINNRGAYFSGGAVAREQEIGDAKLSALTQLGLQATAADFSNLTQQGLLAAEESQFIQDQLYNNEASAYARWTDQRDFSYQSALQSYQIYTDERNYLRDVFESDRTYNLQVEEMEMQRKQLEQTYSINDAKFEQLKTEWKNSNATAEQKLANLKSEALTNSGIFGTKDGEDVLDALAKWAEKSGIKVSNNPDHPSNKGVNQSTVNDGGIFDINSFLNE